jgi:alkylation response protein AidB-like acyl-CoA dehydrogenase
VLAEEDWRAERALLDVLRAADVVGACERALDLTVAYAADRRLFGVALATLQAVQHMCADMRIEIDAARLMVYRAVWLDEVGDPDTVLQTLRAVLIAARMAARVGPTAGQAHGGIGFTREYPLQFMYTRTRAQGLRFGPTDALLRAIGDLMLPPGFRGRFDSGVMRWPVVDEVATAAGGERR